MKIQTFFRNLFYDLKLDTLTELLDYFVKHKIIFYFVCAFCFVAASMTIGIISYEAQPKNISVVNKTPETTPPTKLEKYEGTNSDTKTKQPTVEDKKEKKAAELKAKYSDILSNMNPAQSDSYLRKNGFEKRDDPEQGPAGRTYHKKIDGALVVVCTHVNISTARQEFSVLVYK